MGIEYFTVASYDLSVSQMDMGSLTEPSGEPYDGGSRRIDLYSASDNPTHFRAFVTFTPHTYSNPGYGVGWLSNEDSDTVHLYAQLPQHWYASWIELLEGDRQTSLLFNAGDENHTLDFVTLTTEARPLEPFSGTISSRERVDALPAELQIIMRGTVLSKN